MPNYIEEKGVVDYSSIFTDCKRVSTAANHRHNSLFLKSIYLANPSSVLEIPQPKLPIFTSSPKSSSKGEESHDYKAGQSKYMDSKHPSMIENIHMHSMSYYSINSLLNPH